MNKRHTYSAILAIFALVAFLTPIALFAGDPIPGLDVKLGKPPGGQLIATQTTGQNGTVTFTGLTAGETYLITFDHDQVEKIAIKEQGVKGHVNQAVEITMTVKRGEVSVNGRAVDKNDEIDIRDSKAVIRVTADNNGEVRATINTTRSNIKRNPKP